MALLAVYLDSRDAQHRRATEHGILLQGGSSDLCLELAQTDAEREKGLSGRDSIGDFDGMAFVFSDAAFAAAAAPTPDLTPDLTAAAFWMKDTRVPLDLVYVGADRKALDLVTMAPCDEADCPVYPPPQPYLYAFELPARWASEFRVGPPNQLRLGGDCIPFDRD